MLRGRDRSAEQLTGSAASPGSTLGDSGSFCEQAWRSAARGAGESDRAYEFRTGVKVRQDGKRRRQAAPAPEATSTTAHGAASAARPVVRQRPAACGKLAARGKPAARGE
ncbi:unnamed protein product [Prorocentrum cordatum]|uniref:Uncharacterized protein n=1 Tax=Prorocentrum cordatum TaxID=2364126 RepID=A0ABN9PHA9_9DINO|nr:unnamed protein product [Polarella glacialis]